MNNEIVWSPLIFKNYKEFADAMGQCVKTTKKYVKELIDKGFMMTVEYKEISGRKCIEFWTVKVDSYTKEGFNKFWEKKDPTKMIP